MRGSGEDAHKNILFPKYEWDQRLKLQRENKSARPPSSTYYEVGYDKEDS